MVLEKSFPYRENGLEENHKKMLYVPKKMHYLIKSGSVIMKKEAICTKKK